MEQLSEHFTDQELRVSGADPRIVGNAKWNSTPSRKGKGIRRYDVATVRAPPYRGAIVPDA
jgi:hypothetical protein